MDWRERVFRGRTACQREAGGIFHRPEDRVALGIESREELNLAFRPLEHFISLPQQADTFFVTPQSVIEADFPIL